MVLIDRSHLKGKAPRFSAEFKYPLSYEKPFKFPCHLVGPLAVDNIIAMSDLNIHSTIFKLTRTRTQTSRTRTGTQTGTQTATRTRTRTRHRHARTPIQTLNFHTFPRYPYGAIVAIASFGLLVTHHGASSSGAINL